MRVVAHRAVARRIREHRHRGAMTSQRAQQAEGREDGDRALSRSLRATCGSVEAEMDTGDLFPARSTTLRRFSLRRIG
jgi:hypothetical protein